MKRDFVLSELEEKLNALEEGGLHQISRRDYERLFGTNDAALGRLRNFVKGHSCAASFSDHAIVFRKNIQAGSQKRPDPLAQIE